MQCALDKQGKGHWHNFFHIPYFMESGIFVLFEAIALEAENLQVFKAEKEQELYKITFDLRRGKYVVYYKQAVLTEGTELPFIDPASLGMIMLKGGDSNRQQIKDSAYRFLISLIPGLLTGAMIMTDKALASPRLEEMPIEREEVKLPPELAHLDMNPYYGRIAYIYRVREGT